MEGSNNTDTSCYIEDPTRKKLLLVLASVAGISLVICGVSLLMFVLFVCTSKTKVKLSVRLLLYLIVAAMVQSLAIIFQTTTIDYRESDPMKRYLCTMAGFLIQYFSWVVMLFATVATAHIMIMAVIKYMKRNFRRETEYFYVLLSIILPLTFSWIPFIHDSYGLSGAWCWIQKYDENCKMDSEGYIEQYALWFLPQWLMLLVNLIFIVGFFIVLCKARVKGMPPSAQTYLLQQTVPLLAISILIQLSNFVGLAVHSAHHATLYTNKVLWMVNAISTSIWGFIIGVVFLVYQCVIIQSTIRHRKGYEQIN